MQRKKRPAPPVAGGGRRRNRFPASGGWHVARLALWACAVCVVLGSAALAQPPATPGPGGTVQAPGPDQSRAQSPQSSQPSPGQPPQWAQSPQWAPGQPPAAAADPRQGERWLVSYRGCIERNAAGLAAHGGDVRQVAETAYGACRHLVDMAGVPAERRDALEQAAWSYALQAALRRMEGEGGYGATP